MRQRIILMVAFGVVVLGACGEEERSDLPAEPREISAEERNRFEALPSFPRSDAVSALTEKNDTLVRSFTARDTAPGFLIQYLDTALVNDGWEPVEGPEQVGPDSFRGTWQRDGSRLLVSAGMAPTVDQNDPAVNEPDVQYSFTLSTLEPEQRERV